MLFGTKVDGINQEVDVVEDRVDIYDQETVAVEDTFDTDFERVCFEEIDDVEFESFYFEKIDIKSRLCVVDIPEDGEVARDILFRDLVELRLEQKHIKVAK